MPKIYKEPVGICQAIEPSFWNSRNEPAPVAFHVGGAGGFPCRWLQVAFHIGGCRWLSM